MQLSTSNFANAVTGSNVLWAPSVVRADWANDGYTTTITPGGTLQIRDLFARSVASSWGAADSGQVWASSGGSASDYNVASGVGTILHGSANVAKLLTAGQSILDSDVQVVFSSSALAVGAPHSFAVLTRFVDANNHMRVTVSFTTAQLVTLAIDSVVGGSVTSVVAAQDSGMTHAAGRVFTVRVQTTGSTIRGRVWSFDRSEVPSWSVTGAAPAAVGAGAVGLRTIVNTGGTVPVIFSVDEYRTTNGEVDNISDLVGQIGVTHSLTNGLPKEVASFISGVGTATADVELAYGRGQTAGRYFSPFNDLSPLIAYPRDIPPITIDVGAVTDGGIERIRVFTGQAIDTPVKGRQAQLSAMSATRLKLSKLIQLPGILASQFGMNASWAISYVLYRCGIYVSPPPLDGCRFWAPMHGSGGTFLPDMSDHFPGQSPDLQFYEQTATTLTQLPPEYIRSGVFLMSGFGKVDSVSTKRMVYNRPTLSLSFNDGSDDLISPTSNTGRVEFWVRGDPGNFNASPAGSGGISRTAGLEIVEFDPGTTVWVKAGVDTQRNVRVQVFDGTNTRLLTHSTKLPTDSAWHFVGCAWSVSGNKLWVNLDGVVQTSTPSMSSAGLPGTAGYDITWISYLPASDLQVTATTQANPDTGGAWANVRVWDSAVVVPSSLELVALLDTEPDEAWAILQRFAEAELAVMRTDEHDRFHYLPMGYWAQPAQQTVVDLLSTTQDVGDLEVSFDPITIRNSIRISYTDATIGYGVAGSFTPDYPASRLPPGSIIFDVSFDIPTYIDGSSMQTILNVSEFGDPATALNFRYITANTNPDGSGGYPIHNYDVYGLILSWHPGGCRVLVVNSTGIDYFLVNNINQPPLVVTGRTMQTTTAFVTQDNNDSRTDRGERGLVLDLPAIQRVTDARRVARHLSVLLGRPRPRVDQATVFGDPRRQPGDLVRVADASNTGADGIWRITAVTHTKSAAQYTQKVNLVRAYSTGRWGDGVSRWGRDTAWGRS